MLQTPADRQLQAAKDLVAELGRHLDVAVAVRLWDGSLTPLGTRPADGLAISIAQPGVIASLVRRPTLDRLIRLYAHGEIGIEGGTLIDLGEQFGDGGRKNLKRLDKKTLLKSLWPFLFAPGAKLDRSRDFGGDEVGEGRAKAQNRDFIKFHYDVGNAFYRLFLDPMMQYSCGYFTDWDNTLENAQRDKLEMICRKLRLRPGERFLDIGCGWGGLVCYAAEHFGVRAHGITLSDAQLELARERIASRGLQGLVTVEIRDYADLTGTYDKIASIGMYEHIGVANIPRYLSTVRGLLAPDGLFLNHAISRKAKKKKRRFSQRPEQRALLKYIFPGGELDDIGHTVASMEQQGFEVHDVEAWRQHYARTTRHWCERLTARREEAVALVGEETYRIWVAYLAGCSLAFTRGTARIFQTLVSKSAKGPAPLPPTRADLYR
ncbi:MULTISPECIES: cyclopropane-fatty-acyl-phospholipid synthase family protein [Rhodomicrobium]|uniref:SAM-dependent methyltransferase n=1 Tax=Rhodomicrobium TaxID=1068 RepID=UPI000B4AE609|nr:MULTISPECIES: cyclopropane-fatty-acyl-phospholipid synthase family protein [Rhodomicrobium]